MALKFLNKKGWHTGSLRNIENVWKAEQKHEAEQNKLEEIRKQIQEERERSEFRLLQEQAGLVPKQERLEFLYDSGLAVGKGSSAGGFKALDPPSSLNTDSGTAPSAASSSSIKTFAPGALFEDKPQSANDAWRKLHSDPLLLIRQREQEALARVKNNPIQMAMIRKSVETNKKKSHDGNDDKVSRRKHHRKKKSHDANDDKVSRRKHHHKKQREKQSSFKPHSGSDYAASKREERRKSDSQKGLYDTSQSSDEELPGGIAGRRNRLSDKYKYNEQQPDISRRAKGIQDDSQHGETYLEGRTEPTGSINKEKETERRHEPGNRHRNPVKLSGEERAARLLEMQKDAELHEEQRWKRLKKAEENDVQEATDSRISKSSNFLDSVQKRVYGTEKGGSSTIEESVRRRTHYLQGRSEATEQNAFRR